MRFFNVWAEEEVDLICCIECFKRILLSTSQDTIETIFMLGMWQRLSCLLMDSNFRGHLDVGYGEAIPVMDIAKAMGRDLPIKEDTPGEPDSLCADTRVLRQLGWYPTINIMDHLRMTLVSNVTRQ